MSRNTITTEAEIDVDSVLPELLTYYEPSDFVDIIIEAAQDKTPRYTEESRRRFTLLQSGELVKKTDDQYKQDRKENGQKAAYAFITGTLNTGVITPIEAIKEILTYWRDENGDLDENSKKQITELL
jgi:hypothetical protein